MNTDNSDHYWAGVLTQIPREDAAKPQAEKRHEPLAFVSVFFPTPCHDDMHRRVYTASQAKRAAEIARHNKATNFTAINFDAGDCVLIGCPQPQKVNKLTVTWTGPARGLGFTTPLAAKTQNLVDGKVNNIH